MITFTTQHILRISVFFIFIGRAWQHIFWDAPYRSFFWDETLLKPFVENIFNSTWQEYATSGITDLYIQYGIKLNGTLYVLAAISVLFIKKINFRWLRVPIYLGSISLLVLAVLLTKEKFYHIAQFFEYSLQFGSPFIFLYSFRSDMNLKKLILALKILIAATFFSHGLYAVGTYPVPGKFIDMVITIFGLSESTSITFLYVAGVMDFVVAVLIFIPRAMVPALWYMVIWGLLTAIARIIANFYIEFPLQSIHQNLYETLYRLPHGLVPYVVLLTTKYQLKKAVPQDSLLTNLKT